MTAEIEAGSPANVMATAFWADPKLIVPPGWQPVQVTRLQAPPSELGRADWTLCEVNSESRLYRDSLSAGLTFLGKTETRKEAAGGAENSNSLEDAWGSEKNVYWG